MVLTKWCDSLGSAKWDHPLQCKKGCWGGFSRVKSPLRIPDGQSQPGPRARQAYPCGCLSGGFGTHMATIITPAAKSYGVSCSDLSTGRSNKEPSSHISCSRIGSVALAWCDCVAKCCDFGWSQLVVIHDINDIYMQTLSANTVPGTPSIWYICDVASQNFYAFQGWAAPPSSTGKRYYGAFTLTSQALAPTPFIACGPKVALAHFGGTWIGRGPAPKGFAELQPAVEYVIARTGAEEVRHLTSFP